MQNVKNQELQITKVIDVEGAGPVFAYKLQAAGISAVEALL